MKRIMSSTKLKPPPSTMNFGPVQLLFDKIVDVEPGGELVPFYHFKICDMNGTIVGHLNFKVGDTSHIRQCVGHIGYEIVPEHQGNAYAYYACNAVRPFIRVYYNTVILTSTHDTIPSIKTIEKLNATFINEITVPKDDPSYKTGFELKRRYKWEL